MRRFLVLPILLVTQQLLLAQEAGMTIQVNGPILDLRRGIVLGNGDFSASVTQTLDERLVWRLGKSEIWDRRFAHELDSEPITNAELIDGVRNKGWTISPGYEIDGDRDVEAAQQRNWRWDSYAEPYPQPKPAAELSMSWPAAGGVLGWQQSVDLERGVIGVKATAHRRPAGVDPDADTQNSSRQVESFMLPDSNVLVVRWRGAGPGMRDIKLTIERRWDTFGAITDLAATHAEAAGVFRIDQRYQAEPTFPEGFEVHLAGVCEGAAVEVANSADGASVTLSLADNEEGQLVLAIGTSYDGADAVALARKAAQLSPDEMDRQRDAYWASFWERSNVSLAREDLEQFWRYNTYLMGCVFKPGIISPALYFPSTVSDWNEWKGDYHFDLNMQMSYWSLYATNHADLAEPYDRLVHDLAPIAEKNARELFACRGLAFPFVAYPIESDHLPWYRIPWSRCMFLSAGIVQPLGWRWLYTMDDDYLRETAYPMLVGACRFYLDFLTRDEAGVYHVFPTVSPEHHGITANFDRNRDCTLDLAQIRWLLRTTIAASERLGDDESLRRQLAEVLEHLAPYPRTTGPQGEVWADVEGAPYFDTTIMVPISPVFPGDEVGLGADPETLELARRTRRGLSGPGWFGHAAAARLGMLDLMMKCVASYSDRVPHPVPEVEYMTFHHGTPRPWGKFVEDMHLVLTINEMLLQSYDGTLRLFPCWPRDQDASFRTLRAVGAFLVSASLADGEVGEVRILSEKGEPCRLVNPWAPTVPACLAGQRPVEMRVAGEVLEFATQPDTEYVLRL